MQFGIICSSVATIYEGPGVTKEEEYGTVSAISDEGLCGMLVEVTGEAEAGFWPVRTFYGYTGYMREEDLRLVEEAEAKAWEASDLMVIGGFCVDVTSLPRVQGVRLMSLFRGSIAAVEAWESETAGWAKVRLPDGRIGYLRNQYLWKKEFSQSGVWKKEPAQKTIVDEAAFRQAVTETARTYLGVQYRWGGRSTAGIDCSGLTSVSYMLNGILTYRDAKLMEGYPVHEIPKEELKQGDLLYFPGHIAMYLGDGQYIHSTGKIGSGGVVINSLRPEDANYREDLVRSFYAAGSIFPRQGF